MTTSIKKEALSPVAVEFKQASCCLAGEKRTFYVINNPFTSNKYGKLFRFCVVCGEDRFKDKHWPPAELAVVLSTVDSNLVCEEEDCSIAVKEIAEFVPPDYYQNVSERAPLLRMKKPMEFRSLGFLKPS